jgi:UDP-2,3-diacylglucosamine pyrophosphatase LpxH
MQARRANILVISDLHLGEGIRDDNEASQERLLRLDRELQGFIAHYTEHRQQGRPWRLVVNGDMVDFIAVCLMPAKAELLTDLHPDDHIYGLGTRAHAAAIKMQRVLEHHDDTFRALARFVGRGNELSLVIGNHDAEFHWPAVQRLLRAALVTRWEQDPDREGYRTSEEVADAICFFPWFYLEPGVAWIEHGHQYDPYCSFDSILDPALDELDIDVNIGAAIMRYVANHVTMDISKQWGRGFWGYLQFWASLGLIGGLSILAAYRDMVLRLAWDWRDRQNHPERMVARKERIRDRLGQLAIRARMPVEKLKSLLALHRRPVIIDLDRIVRAIMLDRLLLLFATPLILGAPFVTVPWAWVPGALVLALAVFAALVHVAAREREPVDPRAQMQRVAALIRKIASVPIVVMGHSHHASAQGSDGAMYFNTGTWMPHNELKAFTHLLIERGEDGVRAQLFQWRDGASRLYESGSDSRMAASTSRVIAQPGFAVPCQFLSVKGDGVQ